MCKRYTLFFGCYYVYLVNFSKLQKHKFWNTIHYSYSVFICILICATFDNLRLYLSRWGYKGCWLYNTSISNRCDGAHYKAVTVCVISCLRIVSRVTYCPTIQCYLVTTIKFIKNNLRVLSVIIEFRDTSRWTNQ